MKSIVKISLISGILLTLVGCNTNEPIYESDEISEEEQQKIQDIIDADQAGLQD